MGAIREEHTPIKAYRPGEQATDNFVPYTIPLFGEVSDQGMVRSGRYRAICRPGLEDRPFGVVKGEYQVTDHLLFIESVKPLCDSGLITKAHTYVAGDGEQIVYSYETGIVYPMAEGLPTLASKLHIRFDHTGGRCMSTDLVLVLGGAIIGPAPGGVRMRHSQDSGSKFSAEVTKLIEYMALNRAELARVVSRMSLVMVDQAMREEIAKLAVKPKDEITGHTLLKCVQQAYMMNRHTWAQFSKIYNNKVFVYALRCVQ